MNNSSLVRVDKLRKWFSLRKSAFDFFGKEIYVKAVDLVSFDIKKEEIFGLVGESGCGKTTTGKIMAKLIKPTSGKVYFDGKDIASVEDRKSILKLRREIQIIPQNPYESLSPRSRVYDLISEPLKIHHLTDSRAEREEVLKMLKLVKLDVNLSNKHPAQLSGGQRQRVELARRFILNPKFIIADEPVSMLDASLKGSIMSTIGNFNVSFGTSFLIITHDLSVAWYLCKRIAVMYLGKIVECGPAEKIVRHPLHPYTQALISAVPTMSTVRKCYMHIAEKIHGEIQNPSDIPRGCRFNPRCPYEFDLCRREEPTLLEVEKEHVVACHKFA